MMHATIRAVMAANRSDREAVRQCLTGAAGGAPMLAALTYRQLHDVALRVATQLIESGVQSGDRVAIVLPNGIDFVAAFLGTTYARAVAVPLNPKLSKGELAFYLDDASSKIAIVSLGAPQAIVDAAKEQRTPLWQINTSASNAASVLRPVSTAPTPPRPPQTVEPQPDDVALFLHTSGTTGRPKGVPLTNANLVASMRNIRESYAIAPSDRSLLVMPLFHVHGLIGVLLTSLGAGASVVIQNPNFSARAFWPHFLENQCTWYSAVPTIHQILLRHADTDFTTKGQLRFIRSGSSALPGPVLHTLEAKFGAPVLEAYAMSEAAHQMTTNPLPPQPHKPNSVGKPVGLEVTVLRHGELGKDMAGERAKVHERGEVVIRGPNVMRGYWKNADANATSFVTLHGVAGASWFRTGDEGYLDDDGYLFLTGRIKELINRGGEKIAPPEVDAVMLEHPAVAEAVSFAVPDELYGQAVHAAVVLRESYVGKVSGDDIRVWLKGKLAAFKTPAHVYVVREMPRTATGKIQRKAISELLFKPAKL